ncbi:MAG: Fic family protein [Calditrichaceae bacterium]|nr:Fic family protein [Calditrichaceae bacterium]
MHLDSEISHVNSLLKDFPTREINTPEDVIKKLNVRYSIISSGASFNLYKDLSKSNLNLFDILKLMPRVIHGYLCKDIFSNAGRYRNINDPHNGAVYFGPLRPKDARVKFEGCHPGKIEIEIENVIRELVDPENDVIKAAIKFYQKFVFIHPFYDLNGRIGRLITNLILNYHQYHAQWKTLEENHEIKMQFITKLNKCHKQMDKPSYEYKIDNLYRFWKKYVISFDDLIEQNK